MIVLKPGSDLRDYFVYLRYRADVLKCCGVVDNLRIIEYDNRNLRAVCVKCLRKHRLLFAETGHVGALPDGSTVKRDYRMSAEPGSIGTKR